MRGTRATGHPGSLPPLAQAQPPTTCQKGAIRSGLPELPLPKPAQALPSLHPVPEALDSPVPAATAALAPVNTCECQVLCSGSPGLFQAALAPAFLLQQLLSYSCSLLPPPECWVRVGTLRPYTLCPLSVPGSSLRDKAMAAAAHLGWG